jgi:hypothetical protein
VKEGVRRKTVIKSADTWFEWVDTLRGQVDDSFTEFSSMYGLDIDGFWLTYQGASPLYQSQALSMDDQKNLKLMDPDTNEPYVSMSLKNRDYLSSPIVLDSMNMTYEALVGTNQTFTEMDARTTESSKLAYQIKRRDAWLKSKNQRRGRNQPKERMQSVRDYSLNGFQTQENSRKSNIHYRNLLNMMLINRLANPALFVSAFIEVPFRNMLEHGTNILTGQYSGFGAAAIARTGERLGVQQKFTPDEIKVLNGVAESIAGQPSWFHEVYGETTFQKDVISDGSVGRAGRLIEGVAGSVARITGDPRWGMRGSSAAKRYNEGVWEYFANTNTAITVAQYEYEMVRDPLWLMNHESSDRVAAHQAGMNRIANVRSTKNTVAAKTIMTPINALLHGSLMPATLGFALMVPFQFTRFAMNQLMTLTGLSALDQTMAMFLDKRDPGRFAARLNALVMQDKYNPSEVRPMDMSDVIEGVDLSRAFVRGAVTQAGLMAAGVMFGSFGLGGEDEEARRRRRMAEALNAPLYYDPRRVQNDFRWADAIYLDNVPGLSNIFYNEDIDRSAVVPHWILRQYISPVMGMARFLETGNTEEIRYGFWDAASAIPNSILNLWSQADLSASLFLQEAAKLDGTSDAEKQGTQQQLIINAVAIYERALIENQFVNSVRTAMDTYDRDPWTVPKTANENTGELDRLQGSNLPQPTNALTPYLTEGEDPKVQAAYDKREGMDGKLHQYTENNLGAALALSLFTGQWGTGSTYLRKNMVPRGREVALPEATKAEAEALILSEFLGKGGQEFMTRDEIVRSLKYRDDLADVRWEQESIEAQADAIYEVTSGQEFALSIFDENAQEVVTKHGMKGIYKSLQAGLISFGSPELNGVWVSREIKDEIAKEWQEEIIQEGIDNGLPPESAAYRMRRYWYGDNSDPSSVGLRELLYSDKIPEKGGADYNQLNVTYVIGPDGKPWATPFQRQTLLQAAGIPMPSRIAPTAPGTRLDQRGNVVDEMLGINTGLAAVVPVQLPEPKEKEKDDLPDGKDKTPTKTPYGRRGYYGRRGGGGGGGGGYISTPDFIRMIPLPEGQAPRIDDTPMINTNSPYIRRARIDRMRINSERGRLKQWQ